jgi:hypothetical protein
MLCGLPAALVVTLSVPDAAPSMTGANLTWMVQLADTATVVQVLALIPNGPETLAAETVSGCVPVLLMVTVCAALVVFTVRAPKVSTIGLGENIGAPAVGVTLAEAIEGEPAPCVFDGVTVQVTGVPLVSPVTVMGEVVPVAICPPQFTL